jgi:hypothetical protein
MSDTFEKKNTGYYHKFSKLPVSLSFFMVGRCRLTL